MIEIEEDNDTLASPDQEKNTTGSSELMLHDGGSRDHNDIDGDNDVGSHPGKVIQFVFRTFLLWQMRTGDIKFLHGNLDVLRSIGGARFLNNAGLTFKIEVAPLAAYLLSFMVKLGRSGSLIIYEEKSLSFSISR